MRPDNCRIVNVFSGEIVAASIAVTEGGVVGSGAYTAAETRDLQGRLVDRGLIHVEKFAAHTRLRVSGGVRQAHHFAGNIWRNSQHFTSTRHRFRSTILPQR